MNPWPGKAMISVAEFCEFARVSPKVVRGKIDRRELRAVQLGREWRIPRAEAFRVLELQDPAGPSLEPAPVPALPELSPGAAARLARMQASAHS